LLAVELPTNTNTSRAIWSLISDGQPGEETMSASTRYSGARFIRSHAGGSLLRLVGQFLGSANALETLAKGPEKDSRLYHLEK
jgi:hypothetical protein